MPNNLNFFFMKNDDLLKQFEVEELEQRLEFGSWSGSVSAEGSYTSGSGFNGSAYGTATYTF